MRWLGGMGVVLLLLGAPADASVSSPGKTTNLIVNRRGLFFFDHTSARTAMPSCATFQRWVIDAATPAGQAMMSLVVTANAQGRSIEVVGTGGCDDWSDTEATAYLQVVE